MQLKRRMFAYRWLRRSAAMVSGVLLAGAVAVLAGAGPAAAAYNGVLTDADAHYASECGPFWPRNSTFATSASGGRFAASWEFTLAQPEIDSLRCLKSRYRTDFVELDFRLFDFEGVNDWDGYTVDASTNLPGAVHDVGWSDHASNATPGVTNIWVDNLRPGVRYHAGISWSDTSGIRPVNGGRPRVSMQWVPSYWASSLAQQLFCGQHSGAPAWCIFGQVSAFVSHGFRDGVSVPLDGVQTVSYPADPTAYGNHIVQWLADNNAQRTAWLVTPDMRRLWIPDAGTYFCLKNRGVPGPDQLPAATLDRLPDQTNMWAACGDALLVNRVLRRNMYLRSGDGRYVLWLQGDGNLVLYGPSGRALWANSRFTTDFVIMQGDGNLVGYNNGAAATWASNTHGSGANRLVVQNDGNLVLYSPTRAVWATNTAGRT